jgi:DNA polymerase III delta subunit
MPLYCFYGNQHEAVLKARDEVVAQLIDAEFRNENLTNYYSTASSQKISLSGTLDEIAGDLATMSFFPGAAKVAIVTNPEELFAAEGEEEGKTGKAGARRGGGDLTTLLRWLETELPQTGNHLILLGLEDEAANRTVNDRQPNALLKLVQKVGWVRGFNDKKAMFKIEDAIIQRDLTTLLEAIRSLWSNKTNQMILNKIIATLRFLMQSNIARDRKLGATEAATSALFPTQANANLFKAHPFVQKKYQVPTFRTADLLQAYQQLLDVYRAMRPRPGDVYVPDARGLLEQTIVQLFRSPRPRR